MQTEIDGSVFAGFRKVLRKSALIFALIIMVLISMILYQYQRSEEAVRSVAHTRQVIAYIDTLRTYLLNLDTAVRQYAESHDPADLDPGLICRPSQCPSAERLIALIDSFHQARISAAAELAFEVAHAPPDDGEL